MGKMGLKAGLAACAAMMALASVPARAQDGDMRRHMEHRMMRHEMHREMRHRMMRHEMRRHMMHREMRREMRHGM